MGTVIRIQEQAAQENGFQAAVSFNDNPPYTVTVTDPFSPEDENRLGWYFEEYLRFPFMRYVEAQKAAASITDYGEALFKQVFVDNIKVFAPYKAALQGGLTTVRVEIAGSPKFHALHWEAMKDSELPRALALQGVMVRKNLRDRPVQAEVRPSSVINVLLVAARPFGGRDMDYRSISRPLMNVLSQSQLPVQVEMVRPGTYEALAKHLQAVTDRYTPGYYQVIHFDLHGSLLTYEQLQEQRDDVRFLCNGRFGRQDIIPFVGQKAFLAFEGDQDNQSDPVEASELADLLLHHQIPIAILNACQSGKQVGDTETSLGSRLMQAGIQLVLAMGYSVTVSAAALLMQTLYQHLFAGDELALAIREARAELCNRKGRRAYYDQQIDLEDWLLPVVYQNQPMRLAIQEFTTQEREVFFSRQSLLRRGKPSDPVYGFVGRDLDILRIERRLLTKRNIVLVRGMGGAGKTTLLQHLRHWWQLTKLVDLVFYFGYDERAWTRQQILHTLARQLLSEVEYLKDFQPLSLDAQQAMLMSRLSSERHLLIFDNLESITGSHLAIKHTLSKKEQQALRQLLSDLSGGQTLVLLGSRSSEEWLSRETFEENIYNLGGLDEEAASVLAEHILAKYNATKYRTDKDLQHLLKLLDGFPLALEVVLPNLARQAPQEVLAALQSGSVDLDTGDPEDKTRSILRCIDYSHSNLSPEAQQLLLCLAPFTSVFDTDLLNSYTNHLKQQPALSILPFERWQEVLQAAVNWGLLSPDPDIPRFLRLQPTLSYFLRTRLNEPGQAANKAAIETAFREHYDEVGQSLYYLLTSKEPQERQVGQVFTRLEYENLVVALNLALAAEASIADLAGILLRYLDWTQNQRQALDLFQSIEATFAAYSAKKLNGSLGVDYINVIGTIANSQLDLKQYVQAEAAYQKAMQRVDSLDRIDEETKGRLKATTYHHLGWVAQEQRQWQQAEQYYQQALQIFVEYQDRYSQAKTYHNLGMVAQEQRQWPQAREYLLQALEIFASYEDDYSGGIAVRSLARLWRESEDTSLPGMVAEKFGVSVEEAEKLLREMLENDDSGTQE